MTPCSTSTIYIFHFPSMEYLQWILQSPIVTLIYGESHAASSAFTHSVLEELGIETEKQIQGRKAFKKSKYKLNLYRGTLERCLTRGKRGAKVLFS